jgi:hypothetical protein
MAALAGDPETFEEAAYGPNKDVWIPAMYEELERMRENGTWALVKPLPDANIVGSRWTYLMKHDAKGNPTKAKARLMAQGFSQMHRVDFNETYTPTANTKSICLILALANHNDWPIHQADYKNAYLNAELDETIYMRQPPGFVKPGDEGLVC